MAFKILAGPHLNDLGMAFKDPVMTPSAATGFPSSHMRDGRASVPAMFGSAALDSTIVCDKNIVAGGDGEDASDPSRWTPFTTGTVDRLTSGQYAGTGSLRLTPVAADMVAIQDVMVRPDARMHFSAAAYGLASKTASVVVRNRRTGKFLLSNGTWTTAASYAVATPFVTKSTAAWQFAEADFYVEDLPTCRDDSVPLRIYLIADGGPVYFDDVLMWPWTDWVSVHGHNIPPHVAAKFAKSDDNSTWTPVATMTVVRDSFHLSTTAFEARYVRLLLEGQPHTGDLLYVGELVVGQAIDVLRNPRWGGTLTWTERQSRLESLVGDEWVYLHGARPQRTLALEMMMVVQAEYEQVRDAIFRGSRGGSNLIVVAPADMDSSVVILGRVRESIAVELTDPNYDTGLRRAELEIVESALPSLTRTAEAYDAPITEV